MMPPMVSLPLLPPEALPDESAILFATEDRHGVVLHGINEGDLSGNSVRSAGDVNNDGYDDLIIAAPQADPGGTDSAGVSAEGGFTLDLMDGSPQLGVVVGPDGAVLAVDPLHILLQVIIPVLATLTPSPTPPTV